MKIKFRIWLCVAVILVLPIRKTISLIIDYVQLEKLVEESPDQTPYRVLNKEIFRLDIDRQIFENLANQELIGDVKIVKINPSVRNDENEFVSTYTKEVTFEGGFVDILKAINEVEKKMKGIKFTSISFQLTKENTIEKLKAIVAFQSVKLRKNEQN